MKPRGLSRWRSSEFDARSLSTSTTTSRSNRSPGRSSISRICCWKAGSLGLSVITATMRNSHRKLSGSIPAASRISRPSTGAGASCSGTVPAAGVSTATSCAQAGRARPSSNANNTDFIGGGSPLSHDIVTRGPNAPVTTTISPRSAPIAA